MRKKARKIRRKIRTLSSTRFAIELEVEFPNSKDSQKLIIKHRLIRGWEIDFDGSLDNGAEYRPKLRNKLFWKEDCFDQIKEIIGLIKAHQGTVKANTCGLHVHVDMNKFTNKDIIAIIKAFIKQQSAIYRSFRIVPSRKDYAQRIPNEISTQLTLPQIIQLRKKGADYGGLAYFSDRHYALNVLALHRHGTLEFRIFNGTLKINQIKQAIKFAIQFCLKNCKG